MIPDEVQLSRSLVIHRRVGRKHCILLAIALCLSTLSGCNHESVERTPAVGDGDAVAFEVAVPAPTTQTLAPTTQTQGPTAQTQGSPMQTTSLPSFDPIGLAFTEAEQELAFAHVFLTDGREEQLAVETLGGGCGWIDYDRDGRWDLICNQGGQPYSRDRTVAPPDQLFRQLDSADSTGATQLRFAPVAEPGRFADREFSQAVAVGDFDEDGFQDIYICNVFSNSLWMNCGDGTFVETAEASGVDDKRWSSSAAWADLNLDGLLDLYVCNYLQYDPTAPQDCRDPQGRVTLCNPASLPPLPNACFINQGDGRFVDESIARGLGGPPGRSLGVAILDIDGDAWPDIYVANDTDDNHLFLNQGGGTFRENGGLYGCATDFLGVQQGSMGIAVNDFDHNGFQDLYVTNYANESNTLYANLGQNGFQDTTNLSGLHTPTLASLGFGTVMQDFDHQGRMQLFVANGHVIRAPHEPDPRMAPQIFQYEAVESGMNGSWRQVGKLAGEYFGKSFLARGVATGDLEGDGDLDLLILNLDAPATLLRNDADRKHSDRHDVNQDESKRGNWINFSFIGRSSNRFGIGVEVTVGIKDSGNGSQIIRVQQLCGGTSFASTHQPLLSFGLGDHAGPVEVQVKWPSGQRQTMTTLELNQHYMLQEPP